MSEDRVLAVDDMMEEVLGLHPPSWTLVRQMSETILQLAELGNAIFIGRGSHIITAKLRWSFHVRLIGSLEQRTKRVRDRLGLTSAQASAHVANEDRGRARYLKKHFGCDINDALRYHLVINTDWVPHEETARMIGDAVMRRYCPVWAAQPG
jgi:cytidylate kinase